MLDGRDELEADLQQYYGLELDCLLMRGEFRRLWVLVTQLPMRSRTMTREAPELSWDERDYLLALVADNLTYLRHELAGGTGRKPKTVPRPKAREERAARHLDVSDERVSELLFGTRGGSATG